MSSDDVVDALFAVDEGDEVRLEANNYQWASPFAVVEIDEQPWITPNGGVWKSRRVTLEPTVDHPTAQPRVIDVYTGGPRPTAGHGYGPYVDLEVVDQDSEDDGDEGDQPDQDGEDEDESEDEDEADDLEEVLPEDVTVEDVDAAAADHETLGEVADALEIRVGRARTLAVLAGVYGDVRDTWRDPLDKRGQLSPLATIALLGIVCVLLLLGLAVGVSL